MSKSRRKIDFDNFEADQQENRKQIREEQARRKAKRQKNALRSKNWNELVQLEEE